MLSDLFEVCQWILLAAHDSCHSTKRSFLQLLASVEAVAELEKANVVLGHLVDEMSARSQLAQS